METLVVLGPTAVGKSRFALDLARDLGGEIVNADALQAYRGLDIGTAKPSPEERRAVPHHLIDVLAPEEPWSAGAFAEAGRAAIAEISARGRVPIVVGGSGLYLKALLEGIGPLPPREPALREWLTARWNAAGPNSLRRMLWLLDRATAARLSPGDPQRTVRALEVALATGRPMSAWIADNPFGEKRLPAIRVGLTLPRAILYDRIAERVFRMLEAGWLQEVERLLATGVDPGAPGFQAIGYRELVRFTRGELAWDDAVGEIVRATRRFAKRQMTWFRREPNVTWLDAGDLDSRRRNVLDLFPRSGSGRDNAQASDQHPGWISLSESQGRAPDDGGPDDRG